MMRGVSRFEADVLRIVSCLVHRAPAEQVLQLVVEKTERPACLSRTCVELVQDHLRKGVVSLLARTGGWQSARFLQNGTPITGKLWERTRPDALGLSFSRHSLSFLMWLRAANLDDSAFRPRVERSPVTLADRFLFFLAYESLRETAASPGLFDQTVITTNPFVRLMFPEDFADEPGAPPVDLTELFAPENAWLLETLQPWLRQRWRAIERHKRLIIRPEEMTGLGRVQGAILDEYLSQCEQAGRRDLARFLLQALFDSVAGTPLATDWVRNLRVTDLRVADRAQAYQSAMAFLNRATVFQHWTEEARQVSYLDREKYAAAQLWLADWEHWNGEAVTRTAAELVRQLDPLRLGDPLEGTPL
jgi:hypothetical protein